VLLEDVDDRHSAEEVSQRARAVVRTPITVGRLAVCLDSCVGIAFYPDDGATADDLIGAADDAMYAEKHARSAGAAPPRATPLRARGLEDLLRAAVSDRKIEAYFQYQVELGTRATLGAEALLRCALPGRGVLSAASIVPVLARSHLIVEAGTQVLEQACRFAADRRDLHRVAINVCLAELEREGYVERVEAALHAHGLPPERLELELGFPAALLRHGSAQHALKRLAALGVRVALDNVGTDDALRALSELPINTLKIDAALVRAAPEHARARAVVQAITSLAEALSLRVVAEGVEREVEAKCMLELGCEAAQGWLFGAALPYRRVAGRRG
jgi:EAL domain-containing protein (putative c-di-GMP-specific phosphodiesterase class I)